MSKKKAAAVFLGLLLMAALNFGIFYGYKPSAADKEITVAVSLTSDKDKKLELFYLDDKEAAVEDFTADKVKAAVYEEANKEQTLEFKVPAGVRYVRLDVGEDASETKLSAVELRYGNRVKEVASELLGKPEVTNDIADIEQSEQLNIVSDKGDAYLVWNTESWNIGQFVEQTDHTGTLVMKILMCLGIDVIFIVGLRHSRKLLSLPVELYRNRKLILNLAKNDFKTKYAGSYLGIFWAFVQPVVTVLLYWFVFEKGLKAGGINTSTGIQVPFVLWLIAGLVPWFFFSDALNGATNALIEYNYLVKKVVFKISILPIVKIISALFVHVFFIAFMLIMYMASGYMPQIEWIQIIYYSVCAFVLSLGLGYATCALVVFFRDLTQIIGIALQIGTWMTPIMWNFQAMELNPVLKMIFKLNPMFYVVEGYRQALITKEWFWETPGMTIYFWIVVLVLFGFGSYIFKKLQVHFADVL